MKLPSEQNVVYTAAQKTVLLNGDYQFTQVTITGRNSGVVSVTARPILESNSVDDFQVEEFEFIQGGEVNLAEIPGMRTFTILNKRLSALKLTDAGAGQVTCHIRQWGRISA